MIIVCWKWKGNYPYRAAHVNQWAKMVRRYTSEDHRLICITDDPEGVEIETIPLWDFEDINNPRWPKSKPQCYRRLKMFSPEMEELIGPRFMSMDIDCVILGNIDHIVNREEDFIINKGYHSKYNGSLWMMDAGARKEVWEDFDPITSPKLASRYVGSDQAWISYKLKNEKTVGRREGIWSYGHCNVGEKPPEDARIIFFQGNPKPWVCKKTWVKRAYNL